MSSPNPFEFGVSGFGGGTFGVPGIVDSIVINNGGAFIATRTLPARIPGGTVYFNQPSITVSENLSVSTGAILNAPTPLPILYPPQTFYVNGLPVTI